MSKYSDTIKILRAYIAPDPPPPPPDLKLFKEPGLILIIGLEAHQFAQTLHHLLAEELPSITTALITPSAGMTTAEIRAVTERLPGPAIVAIRHGSAVRLWPHARLIIHAAASCGFVTGGTPDDFAQRIINLTPCRN